jgi:hypothetical protein
MNGSSPRAIGRLVATSVLALTLVVPVGVAAAGKADKGGTKSCEPPHHKFGRDGWRHGDGIGLVPPPNWDCNRQKNRKPRCLDEPPHHPHHRRGWLHGDGISLTPPPNWKCQNVAGRAEPVASEQGTSGLVCDPVYPDVCVVPSA